MIGRPHRLLRRLLGGAAVIAALLGPPAALAADPPPRRVVSINLCTDQLALLLAAPGQVRSVSPLAAKPELSMLADRARAIPANHGAAEEIFLMAPDLVLAGSFGAGNAVTMLRGLGMAVEVFPPATSFDDIRKDLRRMGKLLGRSARAEALIGAFDRHLAEITKALSPARPRAAVIEANGYTFGSGTLLDEAVRAAGLDNLATRLGHSGMIALSLEALVMADPQMVVTGRRLPGAEPEGGSTLARAAGSSLAESVLIHPALAGLERRGAVRVPLESRLALCGTPMVVEAVARLAAARPPSRLALGAVAGADDGR
ncbi:ABC transporter substrate-binding protein [Rhodospirillum rubrum]|uniref:Periplasmic binding protein n=1 Tax=Rhodospirillum rubrum (strain ATCC 11170 / ATH 1.1.1 / DSM 467 / LMG 4362 / NCIMB 8255 / S1) TaxID=269796 RepID=Q2RX51_RHORT|nr:ABC transporter substrate-binding protein [Rhodospirillum rubrum]ABC21294.1 Periplasmic binding protein [Rhodospirillum rubrum ATCC 11170]AEO46972.1 periplasmic binding protein [Rhodospirillum rubrum F11]MBK5952876.1 ABC transporter substrate-binding protein [Rhodospirillum rubrum]QXG80978.1 ABC transporter substrate-binding protein [Rhodospirillum rubrum]HAP98541.1 ABC transporter substrate-binding protein [Rhodospirillum rubrum]